MKEFELAEKLVKSFDGTGYEIYQEVESYIGIADIVLKYSNFIWSIECKTSLSLQVIAQAWQNQRIYTFSSICVPRVRKTKGSELAFKICRDYGIGMFRIDKRGNVSEDIKAKINRSASKKVNLVEMQKDYAKAGNANGDRWTPFNQTVDELRRFIKRNPGCKLKEALIEINHHYASLSSAQNSIRQWISSGIIKGIEINRGVLSLCD